MSKEKSVPKHEVNVQAEGTYKGKIQGVLFGTRFNSKINIRVALNRSNFFAS